MIWRFFLVISVLSLLLFAYPGWRLGEWLGWSALGQWALTLTLFSSQLISRFVLRHRRHWSALVIRRIGDFLLGIAPVLLLSVLVGELIIGLSLAPAAWVASSIIVFVLFAGLWGTYCAWRPQVVSVQLDAQPLAQQVSLVQLSDVHIGSRSARFLQGVVSQVNALNPDFVCITGDFIDQTGVEVERFSALAKLTAPVYFSTGNHEHYEDLPEIIARLQSLGVTVLRGESVEQAGVQVIGVDDHSHPDHLGQVLPQMQMCPDAYRILMFHRPIGLKHAAAAGVHLMLSGHTHNGQIKPFNWLVRLQFKKLVGLYEQDGTHLYVNQGTGTWGPVMRLGTRCEITHFQLNPTHA